MMAVINDSQNENNIIVMGNNEYGNLGLLPSNKQYIDTPIVIPMNKLFNNSNKTFSKIICRDKYSLLLDSDGIVYECGKLNINFDENKMDENKENNIGIISPIDSKWFNNEKIICICSGLIHNIVLSSNNNIYCWGSNLYNCCGQQIENEEIYIKYPNIINEFKSPMINVKLIDCGLWHCCVMTKIGNIYTWGLNRNGQLGIGKHLTHSQIPQLVSFNNANNNIEIECILMSSGSRHICVIDSNNYLWAWGYNKFKQIIQTNNNNQLNNIWTPLKINHKVNFVKCGHWYTIFS